VAALEQLKDERETILTRQRTAQESIERLHQEITRATRSGEADTLRELRNDRSEAEVISRDLGYALPSLDHDIKLAEGELHAATVQCSSEQYNLLQTEQVALRNEIEAAVAVIVRACQEKERLAKKQAVIHHSVCPGGSFNPEQIKHEFAHEVTARMQGRVPVQLRLLDWSTWVMTEQGELLR
jgi:hypothetical protein